MRLEDKVCIITGAGMGIGRAAALLFAREGAKVVVADILAKDGEETISMVRANGGDAAFVQVNVTKAPEVDRMVRFAVEKYGKVNVMYNNAGIVSAQDFRPLPEHPEEVWDRVIDVNLKGPYLCCKYVIPELEKCGGGSIINVSSIYGLVAGEVPAYCASKTGVIGLTRALARMYGHKDIRVNAICPGRAETGQAVMSRQMREVLSPAYPYQKPLLKRHAPPEGLAKPEEVAYFALFLASDESSFVTGAILPVDGGWTAV